jgi:hypothetical protein
LLMKIVRRFTDEDSVEFCDMLGGTGLYTEVTRWCDKDKINIRGKGRATCEFKGEGCCTQRRWQLSTRLDSLTI